MKFNLISVAVLAALAAPVAAQATDFTFDPTGTPGATGDIAGVGIIDQAPGDAVAVNGVSAITNFINTGGLYSPFTTYYQSNLGSLQASDTSGLFLNGAGGNFFTFNMGFGEKVATVGANNSATFQFDPLNPVNFFTMYATNAIANNLTGAGFASGTPILQAHMVSIQSSNFTVDPTGGIQSLDQHGADDWAGQQTVVGSGSSDLTFVVDSVDANYFPDLDPLSMIVITFLNTSQIDPFKSIDPSQCFNTGPGACTAADINTVGTLGAVNGQVGSGPSFEFLADANESMTIPEPGTVALLGLGLAFLGLRGSRRQAS